MDLSDIKGAGNDAKKRCLESEWLRFRLRSGWQPNRAALKTLKKKEAYSLVLDQQDSLIRFGVLNGEGVKAIESFPASDRPQSATPPRRSIGHTISAIRAAGKIPIILHYWANPEDCADDDDLLIVTYESMPGAASA